MDRSCCGPGWRAVHSETEIASGSRQTKTIEPSETPAGDSTEKTDPTSPPCSMFASDIVVAAACVKINNGILFVLEMTCIHLF